MSPLILHFVLSVSLSLYTIMPQHDQLPNWLLSHYDVGQVDHSIHDVLQSLGYISHTQPVNKPSKEEVNFTPLRPWRSMIWSLQTRGWRFEFTSRYTTGRAAACAVPLIPFASWRKDCLFGGSSRRLACSIVTGWHGFQDVSGIFFVFFFCVFQCYGVPCRS